MSSLDSCPPPRKLGPNETTGSVPQAEPHKQPVPRAPKPAFKPVDAGWLQWVAENRLRNCSPEAMIVTMTQGGLDPLQSSAAIARMESDPAFLAARKVQQLQYKLESVMANQQKLWEQSPTYTEVEKRQNVSHGELLERYVCSSRPLVLTDVAKDWPALKHWSPHYLKDHFGHLDLQLQAQPSADPKHEPSKPSAQRLVRLSVFVDQVLAGGAPSNYQLAAHSEALRRPDFAPLLKDIGELHPICNRAELPQHASFWFGPGGTVTPLQHDTQMLMHTQIVGRKRWRFISPLDTHRLYNYFGAYSPIDLDAPDFYRFPAFRDVKVLEVIAEPGDTVFLPLGWWHQVKSLDVSLSFSYSNLAVPNQYTFANPTITNWT